MAYRQMLVYELFDTRPHSRTTYRATVDWNFKNWSFTTDSFKIIFIDQELQIEKLPRIKNTFLNLKWKY